MLEKDTRLAPCNFCVPRALFSRLRKFERSILAFRFLVTHPVYAVLRRHLFVIGIGLDWIAASAVQTLETSMWVVLSLSRSCFKLKLHFSAVHVRPAVLQPSPRYQLPFFFPPFFARVFFSFALKLIDIIREPGNIPTVPRYINDGYIRPFAYSILFAV